MHEWIQNIHLAIANLAAPNLHKLSKRDLQKSEKQRRKPCTEETSGTVKVSESVKKQQHNVKHV